MAKYDCLKCGEVIGPIPQDGKKENRPTLCTNCQSKGPFSLNTQQTVYRNYQRVTIQESPGKVPAGRLPRQKDVVLLWDLIDGCKVGVSLTVVAPVQIIDFDVYHLAGR